MAPGSAWVRLGPPGPAWARLDQTALWGLGVAAFLADFSSSSLSAEATCITEMSLLMACWKQNNFVDSLCSTEMNSFYACVDKAQVCRPSDP